MKKRTLVPLTCCMCGKEKDKPADYAIEFLCSSCLQILSRQSQDIPWRSKKVDKNN